MSPRHTQPRCYARRDIVELDKQGGHYHRHVSAMTTERLDGKFEIAAELGYRDSVIQQLRDQRFEELKPKTEEELLELMPESWVDLIRLAKVLRDKYSSPTSTSPDRTELVALMDRALDITNYCPLCQGDGTYALCGNVETCGCRQRERNYHHGTEAVEEKDTTEGRDT